MRERLARIVTRGLLVIGLFLASGFVITGGAQNADVHNQFKVEFGPEGADCDDLGTTLVYLDTATGQPLSCVPADFTFGGGVTLDGFDSAQSGRVLGLADRLGKDGLSDADQRQIQGLVDSIAATIPPDRVPYRYTGLWGWGQIWLGIAVAVLTLGLFLSPGRRRLEAVIRGR